MLCILYYAILYLYLQKINGYDILIISNKFFSKVKYGMKSNNTNSVIEKEKVLEINNKFRSLGLNFKLKGTKLLNKTIQIIIASGDEFFILEDVFDELIKFYPAFNKNQIRMNIKYALDHRNETLSKKNFIKIFGFEYDSYYFTNKTIIEEISRIIKEEL